MKRRVWLTVAAVGVVALGACGSSTTSTSSNGSATAAATGGDAANKSLTPFKIGVLNDDQGVNSYPGFNDATQTATKWINATKGGVDGHPVEVVLCDAGVDAQSEQACGQQFANDPSIRAVVGGFVFAGGGAYSALATAGKSVLGGEPLVLADFTAKNVYFYRSGTPGVIPGISDFAIKQLHAKSGALVISSDSAGQEAQPLAQAAWKAANLPLKTVAVADSEPDLTGPLNAAGAASAGVLMPELAAPGCIQAAQAMSQLSINKPVVTTSLCTDSSVLKAATAQMNGWYFALDAASNDPSTGVTADIQTMRQAWKTYGVGDVKQTATAVGFSNVVVLTDMARKLGYEAATPQALGQAMASFTGPVFAGPPSVKCPGATLPSVCASQYTMEQLKDGKFQLVDGGAFFTPSS